MTKPLLTYNPAIGGRDLLDRQSPYRERIEGVGWRFNSLRRFWESDGTIPEFWKAQGEHNPIATSTERFVIVGSVTCMCGRTETFYYFGWVSVELLRDHAAFRKTDDIWYALYCAGLFGPEHLRKDGYPEEVVQRAERMYRG